MRPAILRRHFLAIAAAGAAQAGTESPRIAKLNELHIHYENYGAGPEALVFIHGWTCDLTFWRGQEPLYTDPRAARY